MRGLNHWGDRQEGIDARSCPGGGRVWPTAGYFITAVTNAAGEVIGRADCDDASKPISPDAAGLPTSDVSSSVGLRWMAPECSWEPEIGMFHGTGGIYSPDLGCLIYKPGRQACRRRLTGPIMW